MSTMNGNPHYNWDWSHNLLYHRDSPLGEVLAAQVDATLAAAYEQRTANLIAIHSRGSGAAWAQMAHDLEVRLGINQEDTK